MNYVDKLFRQGLIGQIMALDKELGPAPPGPENIPLLRALGYFDREERHLLAVHRRRQDTTIDLLRQKAQGRR